MVDWSTVEYTAIEAALVRGSLADAAKVAVKVAEESHPLEGSEPAPSTTDTVKPAKKGG